MIINVKKEAAGTDAVRRLRLKKLNSGQPFMINSRELPSKECYLEYPDGTIRLVKISENRQDFVTLKELSLKESSSIRYKFHLGMV